MNAKHQQAWQALQKVAIEQGISLNQVIFCIEDAIHEAYFTALQEENHAALSAWLKIPCEGEIPRAPELISYLTKQIAAGPARGPEP